jgi:hypothetical protein
MQKRAWIMGLAGIGSLATSMTSTRIHTRQLGVHCAG